MASNRPDDPARPEDGKPRQVRLEPVMDDVVAQGAYSNLATIISGPAEFFIDFGRVVPGSSQFRVFSRVILTPSHAKQLAVALTDHIRRYESSHGAIQAVTEGRPDGGIH